MNYRNLFLVLILLEIIYFLFSLSVPIRNQILQVTGWIPSAPESKNPESPNQAYSNAQLKELTTIKPNAVSTILQNTYEGTVVSIRKDIQSHVKYPFIFTLRGSHKLENTFFLTPKDLSQLEVYDTQSTRKIFIPLTKIKIGDSIIIHETLNLQKKWPDARVAFTITKK